MPAAGRPGGKPVGCGRRDARSGRISGSTWRAADARSGRIFGSTRPVAAAAGRGARKGGAMTDERRNPVEDELPGPRPGRAVRAESDHVGRYPAALK